jgi:amylosucrase
VKAKRAQLQTPILAVPDADARVAERVAAYTPVARALLAALYPSADLDALEARIITVVNAAALTRSPELRNRDVRHEIRPTRFQDADQVGYVAYADRFGGSLAGVAARLDHLEHLHVTYLHLMNVLKARGGENDGGYAIVDYADVEPALGQWADLAKLAGELHAREISLCLDVVMNHTAAEHPWAVAARAGSKVHRDYYLVFDDRTMPDAYEQTLPEVFPEMAPGNFTWDEDLRGWVWTTFHAYQWDLNYANPDVFIAMLDVMLTLANAGVDVLRLDAIAFTWKRMGTNCQNQPEAHLIAQALRAYMSIAAPSVLLKAEAIVSPRDLVPYLGAHRQQRDECHLAYHNQLMVMLWSSLATGDARLATESLSLLPPTPRHAGWVSYLRCHDDIGWAVDDAVAATLGLNGPEHRQFLCEFYRGDAPGSFALGAPFSSNLEAVDERTCGTAASLAGIERARRDGDPVALDLAVRRLLLGYAVVFAFGGTPLIYMGDEIAMVNDWSFLDRPERRADSRWLHRPAMDWMTVDSLAADDRDVERRVFEGLCAMARVRRSTPALSGGADLWMHRLDQSALLAWERRHPVHGRFYGIANVSAEPVSVTAEVLQWAGLDEPVELLGDALGSDVHLTQPGTAGSRLHLGPLAVGWFVDRLDGGVQPTPL